MAVTLERNITAQDLRRELLPQVPPKYRHEANHEITDLAHSASVTEFLNIFAEKRIEKKGIPINKRKR